ncbi:ABC transporter permease, partial [candidate division KSB1 bacterium]
MNKKLKPPKFAEWFLGSISKPGERTSVIGDFEELYIDAAQSQGVTYAKIWYFVQILRSLPLFLLNRLIWSCIMFRNYLKIAYRNILNHKGYSFINIFGLAIGIACCIIIMLWVLDEISFDKFNKNIDNIYMVNQTQYYANGDERTSYITPGALAAGLKDNYPEFKETVRFFKPGEVMMTFGNKKFFETDLAGTDPAFFDLFSFNLIMGDPEKALDDINSIILTESTVEKYFGRIDPIGKTISLNNRYDFKITGVMKDVPRTSHIKFDFLVHYDFLPNIHYGIDRWDFFRCNTYAILGTEADYKVVSDKITNFLNEMVDLEMRPELSLIPLKDFHLHYEYGGLISLTVYIFSLIALLILIIACFNFINLSTARSVNRAKEVGIRKVIGAGKGELTKQFIGETLLFALISFIIAVALIHFFLPVFNQLVQKDLVFNLTEPKILFVSIAVIFFTGFLSGSYPAFILANYIPAAVLKGTGVQISKKIFIRKFLVVSQFSIATILIIFTVFLFKQLKLLQTHDPGFDKSNVINVPIKGDLRRDNYTIKNELLQNPNILNITMAHNKPTEIFGAGWYWSWEGINAGETVTVHETSVDLDFFETFDFVLVDGSFFSKDQPVMLERSVIINEEATRVMNLDSPVRSKLKRFDEEYTIIGVIKDFHFFGAVQKPAPLALRFRSDPNNFMFIKISPDNRNETMDFIEKKFTELNPSYPFIFTYFEDEPDIVYEYLNPAGKIILFIAVFSIIITCLGILGLASYLAENRTKEIGIRKVLGATVTNLTFSFTKEFSKSLIIANLIAVPVSYLIVNYFLQIFAFRTEIDLWIIIGTAVSTTIIAL